MWFQVVIGGGQDAVNVTMTDHRQGKFEAKFFHKVNWMGLFTVLSI